MEIDPSKKKEVFSWRLCTISWKVLHTIWGWGGVWGQEGEAGEKTEENFLQSTCLTQTYFWLKVTEKQLDKGTEILPSQALFLPCFLRFDECLYYL